jgi:hypothetical protein
VTDPRLAPLHRLLVDAHQGGQAKVDALVALVQRTVFVVPWPGGIEGYRTLVNSEGVAALPVFTELAQLEEAARRFGWLDAQQQAPRAEVGARAALNYARKESLSYVVIDIAADHALEVTREEFEPLLSTAARRDSAGPYAGAGKVSSSLIRAVRPTPPPGSVPAQGSGASGVTPPPGALQAPKVPQASELAPPGDAGAPTPGSDAGFTVSTGFEPRAQATFGGGTSVSLAPLASTPPDALFDALAAVLRDYPEVEWAALCNASRGPSAPVPTVGVRVDTGFRQRVNEIVSGLRRAGDAQGAALDVLLLDDAELMRAARGQGVVFYPWRK